MRVGLHDNKIRPNLIIIQMTERDWILLRGASGCQSAGGSSAINIEYFLQSPVSVSGRSGRAEKPAGGNLSEMISSVYLLRRTSVILIIPNCQQQQPQPQSDWEYCINSPPVSSAVTILNTKILIIRNDKSLHKQISLSLYSSLHKVFNQNTEEISA